MSHALNGSSMLEHFKRSNTTEIHNGIMFDFYPGLPHIRVVEGPICGVAYYIISLSLILLCFFLSPRSAKKEKSS